MEGASIDWEYDADGVQALLADALSNAQTEIAAIEAEHGRLDIVANTTANCLSCSLKAMSCELAGFR